MLTVKDINNSENRICKENETNMEFIIIQMWGGMLLKLQENYMSIDNVTWHTICYILINKQIREKQKYNNTEWFGHLLG